MAKDFFEEFVTDLDEFKEKTMAFARGEISVAEYKGFSGGYGSYAQRGGKLHMLRLRMAGGRLTKEKMAFVGELCQKYQINKIKMTTCQSLQLHDLQAADLCDMIESVWKAGFMTRGGGGDFPRNVMCSSLSGVQQGENFDVLPYAETAADYMMSFIKGPKFPRKLKVAFSNSDANETHATFRDLGFAARPDKKFDVYCAGGLGNNPKLGVCVAKAVDPDKILYYIKAMVDTFLTYGNYENRGRARTRYMQDTLGQEGLKEAYGNKLKEAFAGEDLTISVAAEEIVKSGTGQIQHKRVVSQKQEGLYAVYYQPIGGDLSPDKLSEIYETIKDMPSVEVRLTPQEGMYIINCNSEEAQAVLAVTEDGAETEFERSVACVGNSICQVGARDSQELLQICVDAVRQAGIKDGALPRIHISGCPSSCGTQQIGKIGFRGAVKQTADGPKPAFALFVGGCDLQNQEVLAEADVKSSILIEDVPNFLVELGRTVEADCCNYDQWISDHSEEMNKIVVKYL